MSKIGEKPIPLSSAVTVTATDGAITVKGGANELSYVLPRELEVVTEGDALYIKRKNDSKHSKSLHGLWRSIIANAVSGMSTPWEKTLEVVGTGFNVKTQGEDIVFKLGFSHPVVYKKVEGITFQVQGNNKLTVKGIDKQLVGQVAHQIKMIKKPDVYKGKGIKYEGEKLRIKPGKKAKAAGAA